MFVVQTALSNACTLYTNAYKRTYKHGPLSITILLCRTIILDGHTYVRT